MNRASTRTIRFVSFLRDTAATAVSVLLRPGTAVPMLAPTAPREAFPAILRLLPATGAAALAAVVGMAAVGYPMPGGWVRYDLFWDAAVRGLLLWAFLTGGVCAAGLAAASLAQAFGGRGGAAAGIGAVGHAATPLLAAYIVSLFPPATPLIPLGGLYGIRILAVAAPPFLGVDRTRARVFSLATAGASLALGAGAWLLFRLIASGGELGSVL